MPVCVKISSTSSPYKLSLDFWIRSLNFCDLNFMHS